MKKKVIMVAIDEKECSYHALIWALDNLKESLTTSASLLIIATQSTSNCTFLYSGQLGQASLYYPFSLVMELRSKIKERNEKLSLGILNKAKEICATRGVEVETITEEGQPKVVICYAIQKYQVNLLVIGDNPTGALKRAFVGSVSDHCLSNAKCPVLVVKKPE